MEKHPLGKLQFLYNYTLQRCPLWFRILFFLKANKTILQDKILGERTGHGNLKSSQTQESNCAFKKAVLGNRITKKSISAMVHCYHL